MSGKRKYFPGDTRQCVRCGAQIIVTEQMCKYGKYVCSPCRVSEAAEYTKKNRQKKRKWNRVYASSISDKRASKTASYRSRNPEKKLAHQAVQTAMRNGSLSKLPCEVCGNPKTHAHHDDYNLPLSVVWLCHDHHMQRHGRLADSKP